MPRTYSTTLNAVARLIRGEACPQYALKNKSAALRRTACSVVMTILSITFSPAQSAAQLDALKSELRRGPAMASVEQVTEKNAEILGEFSRGFSIERDD